MGGCGSRGRIVREEWERTGEVRPGVVLDAFVVMPDHVHAVIGIVDGRVRAAGDADGRGIGDGRGGGGGRDIGDGHGGGDGRGTGDGRGIGVETPQRGVSTGGDRWVAGCLGAIVNHWKGACTRRIRAHGVTDFAWQPRFHDAVIRDARHLANARRYIHENPARWENHS